jgi:nucleotide-binding universal stress UspA family protein
MALQAPGGRILVGVDGSPASIAAARWAAAEAQLRGMWLHVVYVRDRGASPASYAPLSAAAGTDDRTAREAALTATVREAVGPGAWPAVRLELVDGLPVRVLLDRAAGAAMLVLGCTRSAGMAGAPVGKPGPPIGPVARDCLRGAPCPVVIVDGYEMQAEAEPEPARTG